MTQRISRGNRRGVLTDKEQDILRAALVMGCAGLDGALKQAIRDCLQYLIGNDSSVRIGFEKFIQRKIAKNDDGSLLPSSAKFLSQVLAYPLPRDKLIEMYIYELTGDSLQSAEEVLKTMAALGIDEKGLKLDIPELKKTFDIRNKIIHELDIDLDAPKRKRKVRGQSDLLDSTDFILGISRSILRELNTKI